MIHQAMLKCYVSPTYELHSGAEQVEHDEEEGDTEDGGWGANLDGL